MKKLFRRLFPNKERKAYNKMHRKHRKELIKHARKTSEWDWYWLHESIIMQIKHMHEYYSAGNNVWQIDESRLQIVEQLKHALDLQAEIEQMEDDEYYVDCVYENDTLNKDKMLEYEKKEQELYEELYGHISKYLKWWWD